MASSRRERLAEAIRGEVSSLLRRDLRDPRIGFVTLTGASVSPDLTHARIFVTVLGSDEVRSRSLEALNGAAGYLERSVFKTLGLRKVVHLVFVDDASARRGSRIDELLEQIRHTDGISPAQEEE